jgi:hypothetical protein
MGIASSSAAAPNCYPCDPNPETLPMASIQAQIEAYRSALGEAQTKGDQATARKLEQQISELEAFQQRHPEEVDAPSPFEVFCDLNPSDVNCRVYDD